MKKHKAKVLLAILMVVLIAIVFIGCAQSEWVSYNVSQKADNVKTVKRSNIGAFFNE